MAIRRKSPCFADRVVFLDREDSGSLDSVPQLSERATVPTLGLFEEAMHLLFAFAPFVTFILLGLHLFQIGEVVTDDHAHH